MAPPNRLSAETMIAAVEADTRVCAAAVSAKAAAVENRPR